jgi:type VI secretion system secreted protein VgrG
MTESDQRDVAANAWVEVDFSPDPGYQLLFDGLHGHEELGRPFLYTVDLSSGTLRSDIAKLVGTSATVWMAQSQENTTDRFLNGIVTRVVSSGLSAGAYRYRIEMRPWIWLLTRITDCCIFQSKSAFQIITQRFRDAGFSDFEDHRRASGGDTQLEYCVQYRESTYDFVTRLMEQYGLYYYFKHDRNRHTLMIADDPNAHTALPAEVPFVFDQTEFRTVADHIWEWSAELALHSGKFTLRDYNFTTPSADLTVKSMQPGSHPYGSFEVYEYPGPYDTAPTGHRLTDVRMQAISMNRIVFQAASNARGLQAGWKFTLSHHPDPKMNREYLITRSEPSMSIAEGSSTVDGETVDTYRVIIHAIAGDVPFRLERQTPRPMIRGPQTARVVGATGEEITTDEYGRIKVKFHWDRSDTQDDQRTCWIRVAQMWAGAAWGSIFIPRVDQEVVVEFLEGNPDRPLVTGVVYNANMKVPYGLPDNKTRSVIKTSSSSGGGGSNELRFEDRAGQEEVFFHAQKDYKKVVLNDETGTIRKDKSTTVETGDHTINVSAGKSSLTAAQSITLSVGANSVTIDTTGVTINGMKVVVQASGTMSLQAGASMTLTGTPIALN